MKCHIDDLTAQIHESGGTRQACIWVPSGMLTVHQLPVPKAPRRKWLALIPWMLEEKLLQKPEDMHFVIAGKASGNLVVLAISRRQMQLWQQRLTDAGISNCVLIPDYFALPWQSGVISIGHRDGQILVRSGEFEGFAAAPELAWYMLDKLLTNADARIILSGSFAGVELPLHLQGNVETRHQANLLQGEFALSTGSGFSQAWLATAALIILTFALALLALRLENKRLEEEIAILSEENRAAFYSLFPGLTIRSGDIRATVERFIANQFKQRESLQSDAMLALTTIDRALSACNCDLQSLQWDSGGLQLRLPLGTENVIEQWQFNGYTKEIRAEADSGLLFTLIPDDEVR